MSAADKFYDYCVHCGAYKSEVEALRDRVASLATALGEARGMSVDTRAAFDAMTDAERDVFPLNVQPDARRRVSLAHIESGEGAKAAQGTSVVSVPSKYERLAWFMVCAANDARALLDAAGGKGGG